MASKRKPVCVIVAGMHRSGTSALTRVLSLLGCSLPSTLLSANPTNEAGHWEPLHIQQFNDRLLESAGCAWDDWTAVPQDWFDSLAADAFRVEAAELFKAEFGGAPLTVFKDPRVCRLMPFWLGVLKDLDIEPVVAIPVRHPLEVAKSLAVRDLSDPHHNRLLWLRHVLDTERYTRGVRRFYMSYDDLLESWSSVVSRMGEALDVKWPRMSAQTIEEVEAFLKPQLRHHRLNDQLLGEDRTETEWLRTAYAVVARWASQGEDAEGAAQLDRITAVMDEAGASFGVLALRGRMAMSRVRELELELDDMRRQRDDVGTLHHNLSIVVRDLQEETAALKGQIATSGASADEAADALIQANAKSDAAEAEVGTLKAALAEAADTAAALGEAKAASEARIVEMEAELARVQQEHDALTSAADANQQGVAELQAQLAGMRSLADQASAALEEANTRSEAIRADADARVAAQTEATQVEVEALNAALAEATASRDAARAEIEALTESLGAAARNAEGYSIANEAAKAHAASIEAELNQARGESEALTAALDEKQQAIESLQERFDAARSLADDVSSALEEARTRGDAARDEANALAIELGKAVHEREVLEAERDQHGQMVKTLKSNIGALLEDSKEAAVIRDRLVAAEDELSDLTRRLAGAEAELTQSTSALRQRGAEADDAYKELERLRDLLQAEVGDKARMERAVDGLKANLSLLMSDIEERDAEVARVRSEAEGFRVAVQAGQMRLNDLVAQSQIAVESLVRGIASQPAPLFQTRQTTLRQRAQLIRDAGIVDPDWYRSAYPEVEKNGEDPVDHFVTKGYFEGRRPKR